MDNTEINVGSSGKGQIVCDNPSCDFAQEVSNEETGQWVNVKCPKCDAVLLTPEDYNAILALRAKVAELNATPIPPDQVKTVGTFRTRTDGSGKITIEDVQIAE